MIIVEHRVNTVAQLRHVPPHHGIEVDIRPEGGRLILHHDPFEKGEDFGEYLRHYRHSLLIANVKSEGIERKVIGLLEQHGVKDYFLLDVSFPFIVKLMNNGVRKLAVRFSEYESLRTCQMLAGKVDWVFADVMSRLPLTPALHERLGRQFKICLVSPELLGRPEDIGAYQKKIGARRLDAVLTKLPARWEAWRT